MLTVEEAQAHILRALHPLPAEIVDLLTAARRGSACAADVRARRDAPSFANSAMDGFAVRAAETVPDANGAPRRLALVRTIAAGEADPGGLRPGEAARIFTGAPVPSDADAVVMQEYTRTVDDQYVYIDRPAHVGQHIRQRGEDMRADAVIIAAGSLIAAGEVGALASQGIGWLPVHRQPVVAIVPTGDELHPLDAPLPPGGIVDSNSLLLAAQVHAAGAVAVRHPPVSDTPETLRAALAGAARSADVVLTCGGVSVGARDWVREVLTAVGNVAFWQVAIKPGKPLAFGHVSDTPVIGLPGNPVSAFVCFELFVRPALRRLAGHSIVRRSSRLATLQTTVRGNAARRSFLRCSLQQGRSDELWALPHPSQGSGQQSSLLAADGLIDVPAEEAAFGPGSRLPVLILNCNHCIEAAEVVEASVSTVPC